MSDHLAKGRFEKSVKFDDERPVIPLQKIVEKSHWEPQLAFETINDVAGVAGPVWPR